MITKSKKVSSKKATPPKFVTMRNIKILAIVACSLLLIGYFANIATLLSVYDLAAECDSSSSCDENSISKQETYVRIGSALIYLGIALLVLSAAMVIRFQAIERKHKKNDSASKTHTP